LARGPPPAPQEPDERGISGRPGQASLWLPTPTRRRGRRAFGAFRYQAPQGKNQCWRGRGGPVKGGHGTLISRKPGGRRPLLLPQSQPRGPSGGAWAAGPPVAASQKAKAAPSLRTRGDRAASATGRKSTLERQGKKFFPQLRPAVFWPWLRPRGKKPGGRAAGPRFPFFPRGAWAFALPPKGLWPQGPLLLP